jgi:hypothetical protein
LENSMHLHLKVAPLVVVVYGFGALFERKGEQ